MIRVVIIIVGLLALCMPGHARVVESFRSGGWHGDAFVNDSTGLFNSCVAIARYRSGISMSVEVDSVYNWWIGFSSESWTMTTGEKIPLTYRIDGGEWQHGVATAISPQLARMAMPADGYIVRRFRRGRTLYVRDKSYNYQFRLTGTSRLLARLARCVEKNSARFGAGPALSRDEGGAETKTPVVQSPEPVAPATADMAQLQVEATQRLFNLMAGTGLTDLKLIAEADREEGLKGLHAVAGNDTRTIVAHVYPEGSFDSETDIMARLIFEAAKSCEGDFSSGFSADPVGGDELFAGRASCAAGDAELLERYAIAPRGAGGVLVFGVADTSVGEGGGEASAPAKQLTDDAFHRAAVEAVR